MSLRVLNVGQCEVDGPRMTKLLQSHLSADVDRAATADEAKRQLAASQYDVVLVNRELAADGSDGVSLIADLVGHGNTTPVMLVSDLSDAQEAAVAAGAVHGFGKSALDQPATFDLIRSAAGGGSGHA